MFPFNLTENMKKSSMWCFQEIKKEQEEMG